MKRIKTISKDNLIESLKNGGMIEYSNIVGKAYLHDKSYDKKMAIRHETFRYVSKYCKTNNFGKYILDEEKYNNMISQPTNGWEKIYPDSYKHVYKLELKEVIIELCYIGDEDAKNSCYRLIYNNVTLGFVDEYDNTKKIDIEQIKKIAIKKAIDKSKQDVIDSRKIRNELIKFKFE